MPHNNSGHFDSFDHDLSDKVYALNIGKISPYLRILLSDQFQKKKSELPVLWWTQIQVFLIGKGLPD